MREDRVMQGDGQEQARTLQTVPFLVIQEQLKNIEELAS